MALELIVRVAVTGLAETTFTGEVTVQVAGLDPVGADVAAQVRATLPVNPFVGFTEMVEVFPVVAPARIFMFPEPVIVKPGVALDAPLTIAVRASVWIYVPLESMAVMSTL